MQCMSRGTCITITTITLLQTHDTDYEMEIIPRFLKERHVSPLGDNNPTPCVHTALWLVGHDTMRGFSHVTSVWYFFLQVLQCRCSSVGRGGHSASVLLLDCVCYADKGKICHWAQQCSLRWHFITYLTMPVSSSVGQVFSCTVCTVTSKPLNY